MLSMSAAVLNGAGVAPSQNRKAEHSSRDVVSGNGTSPSRNVSTVSNFGSDDEEEQDRLMRTIDQAALAIVKAQTDADADESTSSKSPPADHRRLRVPQPNLEDTEDGFVADTSRHYDASPQTDTLLKSLPATRKRTKDEVDVAAAGIPLEVRRMQCTKALLALKEATKNDATPQSSKLVDFVVSLTFGDGQMCSEREMCQWLVAQMCDRMETGQMWIMAKTSILLFALLWRGSNSFVEAVHEYGKAMFDAAHLANVLKSTTQENVSGAGVPSSLQPAIGAHAGQPTLHEKVLQHGRHILDRGIGKAIAHHTRHAAPSHSGEREIPEGDMTFLVANTAYMESLCQYRVRHPTLDLAHGEILTTCSRSPVDPSQPQQDLFSPEAWKELLDDTLELMKAIAVMDPHANISPLSASVATLRVRDSVLLYQVACRALVRLLHAAVTKFHTFVASMQVALQVPSSNLLPPGSPSRSNSAVLESGMDYFGESFDPSMFDFTLTPRYVHNLAHEYYFAIYQFNRTVNMLKTYCEASTHIDRETAKKAVAAFKVLPEACILEFRESRKVFADPLCYSTLQTLFQAAQKAVQHLNIDAGGEAARADSPSAADVSSPTAPTFPLGDGQVRNSMRALRDFHAANQTFKQTAWTKQVDAVCGLFNEKESQMLHQIFSLGLAGLYSQWQEFTNNGAAAAEKAFMTSADLKSPARRQESSSALALSTSENAISDSLTKSSTYILRSLPASVRVRAASSTKTDVITLDRSATEKSMESSIDALLQEDDVVVICNEECSCNDTLKLVDRFQVLLDVPLGEGSYGKVYRAWDEVVGCYLAAKELPLDASKAHNVAVREVLQEYTVLTELSHPNIVRVVAFMVLKQTARIYMEWMPSGSLQDVLRHHPRGMLRESVVRRYARDVLSGLAFLHSRGVIHRDVKPGNMLLSSDGAVKLTDFGTSLVLSGNTKTLESGSVTGTAAYMAPECVQGTYSSASDIWSFGCSIVQLISGNVPWLSQATGSLPEPIALLFKIGNLDDTTHLSRPHDLLKAKADAAQVEDELTNSLSSIPSPDVGDGVTEKPPVKEAVSTELLSMLDAIFVVDRKKRPSASELMQHPFFKTK